MAKNYQFYTMPKSVLRREDWGDQYFNWISQQRRIEEEYVEANLANIDRERVERNTHPHDKKGFS